MTNIEAVKVSPILSSTGADEPPAAGARVSTDKAHDERNTDAQVPDTPETRAVADAQLARPYALALATRSFHTSMGPMDVQVPAQSTLGRWRTQLDDAFKSRGFLSWAKEQGLDSKSLKVDPFAGELTGIVNGKIHTFSLEDNSGWSDISRVLLSIARVIAPKPGQAFSYPWPDGKVPLYTVGRFYAEPIDLSPSQAAAHREKLRAGSAFEFAPVGHASQRSVEALVEQGKALGDDANRHALIAALNAQVDDAEGKIDLNNVMVPIDRRSSLFIEEQRREISVAQMLENKGHKLPGNRAQALGLANALSFDLAHRMPGADGGGVRHIAGLLNKTALRKMKAVVDPWKLKHASPAPDSHAGAGSFIRSLMNRPGAPAQKMILDNPPLALDQLIRTPDAQTLGLDIQKRISSAESPTGAIEALTAALLQDLDPNPDKSCFNVAGYNLYQRDNMGASASEIVKRFTTYLETKLGADVAPLAAQLLLSAVAPELKVKNIPPELVFGSYTWTEFSIAVALVEQGDRGGASGNMTFRQIVDYADVQLNILEDEDALASMSINPLRAWGVANKVIKYSPDGQYTPEEVEQSQRVLKKQKRELEWARTELLKPPPTRESEALSEFKRVYPDVDPTKTTLCSVMDSRYIVSPLDVYMTKPFEPDRWKSRDEKELPWTQMKSRFSELDNNIGQTFAEKFEGYKKTQAAGWAIQFKYQASLLSMAEQERISQSTVTFMRVSRPFLGTEETNNLQLYPGRQPRKPTPHELKELEGGQGLLMKVEGGEGAVEYFSYFPALGKIVKEKGVPAEQPNFDDRRYFSPGYEARVPGTYNVFTEFATNNERDSPDVIGEARTPYFSQRNGSLGAAVGDFFTKDYDYLKTKLFGETRIEKNTRANQAVNNFLLSLIPFYDGIKDAIDGNVAGAAFNIGFDFLGFFLPGASAANRALKLGKSAGKVLKRSFFAGVGASVGVTDIVDLPKNFKRGIVALGKDLKTVRKHSDEVLARLKGNYRFYEVTGNYKEGDIVKGFYQVESDGVSRPVVALFKKGAWYAYSTVTNTPFGPQLAQFGVLNALTPSDKP